jgi:2-polyprenyl-3-methyl-5-hydroxy-6-metoxy-1,4-benzoquinol methylase
MTEVDERVLEEQVGGFVERVFGSLVGALDLYNIDVGVRVGLYEALASSPVTAGELAERTGCAERYVREWLEQQTVSGIVEVDDPAAPEAERRFTLPAAHQAALLDLDSPAYVGALAQCATELAPAVAWLAKVFRSGEGVPLEQYGEGFVRLQEAMTRPLYAHSLTGEWLPALGDVDARLRADPPARVADLACGAGLAAVALAKHYPAVTVDGFDLDETSIAIAKKNAAKAGVADRVRFQVRDVSAGSVAEKYDLVTIFEAIHDMARPVEALRGARALLADDGRLIVADENAGESFAEPGPLDGFLYGASVLACLPQSLAEQPSAAIGTVIRPATMAALATEAGFSGTRVLPIENDFWRFYELLT